MNSVIVNIPFSPDELDELQVLGELSWLADKARREEHGVRVGIDLDESQIRAATIIAQHHNLEVEEAIEHIVLLALQEATLAVTRPGMSIDEVTRTMTGHSGRIAAELRLRRLSRGGNGHQEIIRP